VSKKTSKKPSVQNVEIPSDVYDEFKRMVKANGQTLRFVVRQLIIQYIQEEPQK